MPKITDPLFEKKRALLIKILDTIGEKRKLAPLIKPLIEGPHADQKSVDGLLKIFHNAVNNLKSKLQKKKFISGIEQIQNIKFKEELAQFKDELHDLYGKKND